MFGRNEIVGKKYFQDAPENKLFVTSIFLTLQGESIFAGRPAIFVRLAKCNLACSFCDTFFDDGDWLTFEEIEQKIENTIDRFFEEKGIERPAWTVHGPLIGIKKKMVLVITGGEPTLQKNLGPFLRQMQYVFEDTQIESNGILHEPSLPFETVKVISPKCMERNGVPYKYIKPNPNVLQIASCLKFVISADEDSPYNSVPDWAHEWRETTYRPVYISPMNIYNDEPQRAKEMRNSGKNDISLEVRSDVDEVISFWEEGLLNMEANRKNHEYAAQYCIHHGFNLNLQIHLYASLA